MEPFRITCETCRSRLKIRTPDVIGEIHACPKCGSMVQIAAPAGWDLGVAAAPTDQPSGAGESALSLSTTGSVFIPAGGLDDLSFVTDAVKAPAVESAAEAVPVPSEMPVASSSPLLWWVGGGAASLLVAAGLAWVIWPKGEKHVPPAPAVAAKNTDASVAEQGNAPKADTPVAEKADAKAGDTAAVAGAKEAKPQAVKEEPVEVAAKPTTSEPVAVAPKAVEQPPVPPVVADVKAPSKAVIDVPKAAAANVASSAKVVTAADSAPDHSPVLKFDPLDFDPDRLNANTKVAADARGSTSSIPDKPAVDAAANAAANNDPPAVDPAAAPGKPADAAAAPPRIANSAISARRGLPGDAAQRSAAELLATRMKSFQVTEMPLGRFIDTLAGFAATGITLDPIALEQVGIAPSATVSVNMQDATLQEVLHEALTQRRLDIAEQGGQLRVVLPKADEPHTIDYDVADLAVNGNATAVGQLIERVVEPATWEPGGGKGTLKANGSTLHIEQSDAVRREVVVFCERLRLARNLAIRSKYPAALLSVESPYQHMAAKLGEHTTFTFLSWTRLADVLRGWQEMSGISVVGDWGALAEAEFVPSSPVACSANDRPWQESLDGVLAPLGLGWWAVNGETIQITSLPALEKIRRVEFYQVPPKLRATFATSAALVETMQRELSAAATKSGKPATAHIEVDEPSGRLIVLAAPAAHRFLSHRLGGEAK